MKIKLHNYRNIPFGNPIEYELRDEIGFILGVNNVGKTNFLKLIREFKEIFAAVGANVESKGSGNFSLNSQHLFYDQVANQNFLSKPIEISLTHDQAVLEIIIAPEGSAPHTNTFRIRYQYKSTIDRRNAFRHELNKLTDVCYIGAFRTSSGRIKSESALHDIHIGHSFIELWNSWTGGTEVQKRVNIKKLSDELRHIFGFKEFSIKVNHDKTDLLITTDDGEYCLRDLGDGIGNFIIVLANATIRKPGYILIDEPEISLHPKMQEIFVRSLASKAKHGLLASSHSVGLARSVADNISTLARRPDGLFCMTPFGQHYQATISQVINEMSYSQYVEIGGNNILLVEGRTDIKSYREILRHYSLDGNFIILSLGGKDFICKDPAKIVDELSEIKRLNPKSISVIFDSERLSADAPLADTLKSFEESCASLGFHTFATDYHSTENYITQAALTEILDSSYIALTPYQHFDSAPKKWAKDKNWLMFTRVGKTFIDSTRLGAFIRNTLTPFAQTTSPIL